MQELIDVFKMTDVSIKTRCQIIVQLGNVINMKYGTNITEPIVYELVKHLDPDNQTVETDFYKRHLKEPIK